MNNIIWYGGKKSEGKKYRINEVKLEIGREMTELPKKSQNYYPYLRMK